jgi:hypothetical protein
MFRLSQHPPGRAFPAPCQQVPQRAPNVGLGVGFAEPCYDAALISVTWMLLLLVSTVPETLTFLPENFCAELWSSS